MAAIDLLGWIEEVQRDFRSTSDNLAVLDEDRVTSKSRRIISLLRELVLTDKWAYVPDALSRLITTEFTRSTHSSSIQGALQSLTLENLTQMNNCKPRLFSSTVKKLSSLGKTEPHCAAMTLFLHQIIIGNIDEALSVQCKTIHYKRVHLVEDLKHVMRAYRGLMHYLEWSNIKHKIKQLQNDPEFLQGVGSADELLLEKAKQDSVAKLALDHLASVHDDKQIWDIFISKEIEILEYEGNLSDAEANLLKYKDTHPKNYFAFMTLYQFYKRNKFPEVKRIAILKEIRVLAPFDDVMVDLYDIYNKLCCRQDGLNIDDVNESLLSGEELQELRQDAREILFTLLDYPQWKDRHQVWKLLAQELEFGWSADNALWEVRKCWWPHYCFVSVDKNDDETTLWKTICAVNLLGKDNATTVTMVESCQRTLEAASLHKLYNYTTRFKAVEGSLKNP